MKHKILKMEGITKLFPGVKALDNVNLDVDEGEIHAIVGENGAGKSTLMNVLSGVYPYGSYAGDIILGGEIAKFHSLRDSEEKGIVIIHQELALVPFLTIAENMFLGNERKSWGQTIDWDKTNSEAKKYMKKVGLDESPLTLIKDISVGKQQLVEISKALAKDVKLLILDEPTASLNEDDSKNLLDLLLQLKKNGITCIIISHKLNEISYVADRITIIRDGSSIETIVKASEDFTEERLINGMVGRVLSDRFPKRNSKIGDVTLEVKNWTVTHPINDDRKVVNDVSIKLRAGEVVGISGLMGAGRTELAMSIFGKSYGNYKSGVLIKDGKEINLSSVREAINSGVAYVTEDRKTAGLILSESITKNTTLANMTAVSKNLIINETIELAASNEYIKKMRTRCSSADQEVSTLSGGNQQKVLLSKWLFAEPDILILDEPTRGIDVGAKVEIYNLINEMVAAGKSVLMISSEMPEVLGMSDRIYIMNEGRIVGELDKSEASQEIIMGHILKASKGA